jgi:putative oxidoreductase
MAGWSGSIWSLFCLFWSKSFIQFQGLKQYATYKGVPVPGLSVVVTGLMLLAGGLSILTAYWVEWGLYLLVIFLVVSAFMMHNFWKETDQNAKVGEMNQFLKNIALAAATLMLLSITNWTW